jgi:PAS domain S-box-containing protein
MQPREPKENRPRADVPALEQKISRLEAEATELRARLDEMEMLRERSDLHQQDMLQSQRETEISHDRYADLYDFAPIPYLTLDQNGLIREVNLTAVSLLGLPRAQIVDHPLRSFMAADDARIFLEHMRRCRAGESPVRSELRLRSSGQREVPIELMSRPVRSSARLEFRSILFDLSERIAAEAERRRLEEEAIALKVRAETARVASEAKDRFLAMLSHELRTPLTPIVATLDLLQSAEVGLPAGLIPSLELIRRNIEAEVRLVDDLLDVTRVVGDKLNLRHDHIDLHALAKEVIDDFASQAKLRGSTALEIELTARQVHVYADPFRLKQVIRNLISNALKFSPGEARVLVRTDNPRPEWIRLEVVDNGVGLTGEQLERVFQPFEQGDDADERRQGLGLGLAIAKGIIEAHKGTIQGYSAGPGTGARFAFELETAPWLVPAPKPASRSGGKVRRVRHVLLVEDHADSAEALCMLLEGQGYRVRIATSIAAAVLSARDGCDVLVSDLQLPDGSGHALLQRLPRPLPAIAVSGYGAPEDVQRSREAGFIEHLVKPVSGERLLAAIERALDWVPADEAH